MIIKTIRKYLKVFKVKMLLLLVFSSFVMFGQQKQTVSGVVKDALNGETLIGATVYFKNTNIASITNEYGFYSLTAEEGKYTLVVSYLGFVTIEKQIDLKTNKKINFELEESASQLDEIQISASESKKVNLRTPQMSVSKLSSKIIKQIPAVMGEVDIIKSIQLLPGVTNSGEGASGFNVRGGAEDQNLILLDEAVIYNSSHLFGFFSIFNNDAVKDIKLYKGGIPSQFGGRVSSVLDIRQKDGNSKNLSFTGGIGAISSRLTVEGPTIKDKGSFIVAGRSSYVNLFLKLADNDNSAGFYDLNFKTNYKLNENNKLYLSGYYGQDNFNISEAFSNSYGNLTANLRWNHIFNDKLFSNLSVIYSRYNYDMELDFRDLKWASDINNYNLKYDFSYFKSEKLKFNFGASLIHYKFNPGLLSPLNEESGINRLDLDDKFAFENGIYASLEHKISNNLTAMYGLRYSNFNRVGDQAISNYENNAPVIYNSQLGIYESAEAIGETEYSSGESIASYGNFEPRAAISYKLTDNSSVKASYNRMAQYLHLISNTTSATPLDIWAPSGEYIKPQLADQYAVGYFRNFNNDTYSLEAEAYYKTVDNRVDYIDGADLIAQNNIETQILTGESRSYGLELMLRKNTGKFTGWLAYTLSKAEQKTDGGSLGGLGINNGQWYNSSYDRTHDISFTGNYELSNKWSFGTNFVFQTGRPTTYPNGQFQYNGLSIPTYSERNANRLPAYHRLDISATLIPEKNKNRKWQGEWVFSIYNLYNRSNAASITFGQDVDTGINEATQTSIFGIIPSVTYNFKF